MSDVGTRRTGLMCLLRRPAPRLLWLSEAGSVAGDRLYSVALIWVTLRLTSSPGAVAVVTLAGTLPFLAVSVVSGAIADSRDALRLARLVDFVCAVVVAVVPVTYLTGHLSVAVLAVVAGLLSGLEAFLLPSLQSSLPRLVEPTALTGMVSLLDSTDRLGRILGPGLVGVLAVAVPEVHLFTIDSATFLLSVVLVTALLRRIPPRPPDPAPPVGSRRGRLAAGWSAIRQRPVIRDSVALRAICNLAWPTFTLAVPFTVAHRYHHGIGGYGIVLAAFGAGNLIGNVLSARITGHLARWCGLAWTLTGLGFIALAAAPTYPLFLIAAAAIGICTPIANVTIDAHIAATVPHHLLARVYTAQRFLVVAASAIGLPAAAALTSRGPGLALYVGGTVITAAAAIALGRQIRPARTHNQSWRLNGTTHPDSTRRPCLSQAGGAKNSSAIPSGSRKERPDP
jgi:MFS transporter, DHA3 family, macrolide efflux protein